MRVKVRVMVRQGEGQGRQGEGEGQGQGREGDSEGPSQDDWLRGSESGLEVSPPLPPPSSSLPLIMRQSFVCESPAL